MFDVSEFVIPLIGITFLAVLFLVIFGTTAVLLIRDKLEQEREKERRRNRWKKKPVLELIRPRVRIDPRRLQVAALFAEREAEADQLRDVTAAELQEIADQIQQDELAQTNHQGC